MDVSHLVVYGQVALQVIGGVIVVLAAVAPLTRSDLDNKILAALRKVVELGGKLVGHKSP